MVAGQSDLIGLIPRSMLKVARDVFGLCALPAVLETRPVPVKLVWHTRHEADPAHLFIRKQIGLAARAVVLHGLQGTAK